MFELVTQNVCFSICFNTVFLYISVQEYVNAKTHMKIQYRKSLSLPHIKKTEWTNTHWQLETHYICTDYHKANMHFTVCVQTNTNHTPQATTQPCDEKWNCLDRSPAYSELTLVRITHIRSLTRSLLYFIWRPLIYSYGKRENWYSENKANRMIVMWKLIICTVRCLFAVCKNVQTSGHNKLVSFS